MLNSSYKINGYSLTYNPFFGSWTVARDGSVFEYSRTFAEAFKSAKNG